MRIVIFTDAFLPQMNGVASHVVDIASSLSEHGHQVLVFAPKPRRGVVIRSEKFKFKIELLPSLPAIVYPDWRTTIPSLPKVLLKLRQFHPDVIHIHDPWTVGMEGMMAAKILKTSTIVTFHTFFLDEDMLKNIKWGSSISILKNPLSRLNAYFHNLADIIICPSVSAQNELIKYGLTKPSVVIHNGVDIRKIKILSKEERNILRDNYNLKTDDKVGIFVGRLAADKSIDVLIKSWVYVSREISNAKLVIIGAGPKDKELKELVNRLNMENKIMFTGGIDREKIISSGIYQIADIFISASKIENMSISILEAMASGLPIIAADMRGNAELVDMHNGMLIPPDDPRAMSLSTIELLKDRKKMDLLSSNSLKKSLNFSNDKTVKELEKCYLNIRDRKSR